MISARSIKPEELDRAGEIGAEAFELDLDGWRKAFHQHYQRYSPEHIIVVEHEGQLVAAMVVTPEDLQMGDATIPAGAVGGVGTVVSARRLGCAGAMMHETVRRMKAWGMAGSCMWPFSFAYYRKFGWETGGEVRTATWPRDIAWRVEPDGDISVLAPGDLSAVSAVWNAVGPANRCSTVRGEATWSIHLSPDEFGGGNPKKSGLVCRRGGRPVGYIMWNTPDLEDGKTPDCLMVSEFRALDGPAALALLKGLAERTDYTRYGAGLSVNDGLRSIAVNARDIETALHTSFGFRIVDPGAILPLMRTPAPAEPVSLRIHDELVGTHTWRTALDGAPAEFVTAEPDVECDIRAFAPIASGYLKPAAAAALGLLKGDAAAVSRLDAATAHWCAPFRSGLEVG
jgi:predicted acetyltransferase